MKRKVIIVTVLAAAAIGCALFFSGVFAPKTADTDDADEADEAVAVKPVGPSFNADSAYAYAARQCDFGPRVMNSEAHDRCAAWIAGKFRSLGCTVEEQKTNVTGYDGTSLRCENIIAHVNPQATTRILLCAHYDSRPWADNDPDSLNWHKPVMAANDGASGVAVMLEIARLLKAKPLANIGVDLVCFDAEDWGTPQWAGVADKEETWALGAQYWAAHIPQGYGPRYGILLDMVGGEGSRFYQEVMSKQFAPAIVKKVWRAAAQCGMSAYFPKDEGGAITDDHIPVNQVAHIPTIDIIPYFPDCQQSSFGPTWHTVSDTMDHIDKQVLKAVGQTIVQVLYSE